MSEWRLVSPALLQIVDAGRCDPACLFAESESPCDCRCEGDYHAAARDGFPAPQLGSGPRVRYMGPERVFYDTCPACDEMYVVQADDLVRLAGRIFAAPFWCESCDTSWRCEYVIPAHWDLQEVPA